MTADEALISANLARSLWSAMLRSPAAREESLERMRNPQPGDLVVEVSRLSGRITDPGAIGRLVRVEGDPELGGRYVIKPLHQPFREQGWRNALMVAVMDPAGTVLAGLPCRPACAMRSVPRWRARAAASRPARRAWRTRPAGTARRPAGRSAMSMPAGWPTITGKPAGRLNPLTSRPAHGTMQLCWPAGWPAGSRQAVSLNAPLPGRLTGWSSRPASALCWCCRWSSCWRAAQAGTGGR